MKGLGPSSRSSATSQQHDRTDEGGFNTVLSIFAACLTAFSGEVRLAFSQVEPCAEHPKTSGKAPRKRDIVRRAPVISTPSQEMIRQRI